MINIVYLSVILTKIEVGLATIMQHHNGTLKRCDGLIVGVLCVVPCVPQGVPKNFSRSHLGPEE